MAESELDSLEAQVDSFIAAFQHLTTENNLLRKKIDDLNHQYTLATGKNNKAATTLKKTIKQLQDKLCQTQKK